MLRMKTDHITGPHFTFEGFDADMTIRQMHAGAGKVTLVLKRVGGRNTVSITVDAADLVEAVTRLVPACVRE